MTAAERCAVEGGIWVPDVGGGFCAGREVPVVGDEVIVVHGKAPARFPWWAAALAAVAGAGLAAWHVRA